MINVNLYTKTPFNKSWIVSLLKNFFRESYVLDPWNNVKSTKYLQENVSKIDFLIHDNVIICIDDETFEGKSSDIEIISNFIKKKCPLLLTKAIFIFKTKKLYDLAKNNNLKSVYFPYFDIMEDLIVFEKIKKYPENVKSTNLSFFNLNGRYNLIRDFLLDTLSRYNLMKYGYVTCNFKDKVSQSIIRKIRSDQFGEEVYFKSSIPADRLFHFFDDIPCTLNLKNYFYICENVPGSIYLGVESCAPKNVDLSLRSPSDKTLLPFICKRLPLIIGDEGKIEILESEGFDLFSDILDHSYSKIKNDNYKEKVITCVEKNYEVLKNNSFLDSKEIKERLNKNQEFLINQWYNRQINKFIEDIKVQIEINV